MYLKFHDRNLDVPKRHLAVNEVVQNTAEAPDVGLEADLDHGLPIPCSIELRT